MRREAILWVVKVGMTCMRLVRGKEAKDRSLLCKSVNMQRSRLSGEREVDEWRTIERQLY